MARAGMHHRDRALRETPSVSKTTLTARRDLRIRFGPGDGVAADETLGSPEHHRRALQQQIMLFYTGITRSADVILAEQTRTSGNHSSSARSASRPRGASPFEWLRSGDVDAIGPAVRRAGAKREARLGRVNPGIDEAAARALKPGPRASSSPALAAAAFCSSSLLLNGSARCGRACRKCGSYR